MRLQLMQPFLYLQIISVSSLVYPATLYIRFVYQVWVSGSWRRLDCIRMKMKTKKLLTRCDVLRVA